MHIAWLGKKTPFCGNVTYGREITSALINRGHQVSFMHFADTKADGDDVSLRFQPFAPSEYSNALCGGASQISSMLLFVYPR
jgi:hypothetical protein